MRFADVIGNADVAKALISMADSEEVQQYFCLHSPLFLQVQ